MQAWGWSHWLPNHRQRYHSNQRSGEEVVQLFDEKLCRIFIDMQ